MATEGEEPERLCIWDKLFQTDGPVGQSHADSASVHPNSKHWFTTSFLQGRCRKAMLGVYGQCRVIASLNKVGAELQNKEFVGLSYKPV